MHRILLFKKIPLAPEFGRLFLRVTVFVTLFAKHGAEKLFTFPAMEQLFLAKNLNPVHIGPIPSLVIATIADGICSLLIIVGFATRWAALFLFCNLFVVWSLMDRFELLRKGLNPGESLVVYMSACLAVFFLGAGKMSIDGWVDRGRQDERAKQEQA